MPDVDVISLQSDGWDIGIVSDGRRVVWCKYDGEPVWRTIADQDIQSGYILNASCFPMAPYLNRIADGLASFQGTEIRLSPNLLSEAGNALDPSPMHGIGWTHAWTYEGKTDNSISFALKYDGKDGAWPWPCTIRQEYSFAADTMTVKMTLTNDDPARNMPGGLGLHPYFHREPGSKIYAPVTHIWEANSGKILTGVAGRLPEGQSFIAGLDADRHELDNCYPNPGGWAAIYRPGMAHEVCVMIGDAESFHDLVVYTPRPNTPRDPARDVLCAEPMSHCTDAVNLMNKRDDTGLQVVAPTRTMGSIVTFTMHRHLTPQLIAA